MGKDKGEQRLRQSRDELYDVWEGLKTHLDDATETFDAFRKAVEARFNKTQKENAELRNGLAAMLQRIERRRLNIDAVLRGRARPFPDEKGASSDVLREARVLLASFEKAAAPVTDELFDAVDEEIAERAVEAAGAAGTAESGEAALAAELGGDPVDSEEAEEAA